MKHMRLMKFDLDSSTTSWYVDIYLSFQIFLKIFNTFCDVNFDTQVANPTEIVKMQRTVKRTKVEKKPIDEEAMSNAFNKVYNTHFMFLIHSLIEMSRIKT